MKNKKEYMIIFVTVAALLIDILGREFAVKFVLPVWTDSIGTFLVCIFIRSRLWCFCWIYQQYYLWNIC